MPTKDSPPLASCLPLEVPAPAQVVEIGPIPLVEEPPPSDDVRSVEVFFCITECGHEKFNGDYVWDGHIDGRMAFRKARRRQGRLQKQTLNWSAEHEAWYLGEDHTGYWYKAKPFGTERKPPSSGWIVNPRKSGSPPQVTMAGKAKATPEKAQDVLHNAIDRRSVQDDPNNAIDRKAAGSIDRKDSDAKDQSVMLNKGAHDTLFDAIDGNKDGVISQQQFSSGSIDHKDSDAKDQCLMLNKGAHDTLFDAIDGNRDGVISQQEFASAMADKAYKETRTVLVTSALASGLSQESLAEQDVVSWLFGTLDKNQDRVIDRAEFVDAMREALNEFSI